MMEMVEVKVSELEGAALDFAVAVIEAPLLDLSPSWSKEMAIKIRRGLYQPSTDWSQGGPLIDKYRPMIVYHNGTDQTPMASMPSTHPSYESGNTVLIASCRAIVSAKLGDVVIVPAELA